MKNPEDEYASVHSLKRPILKKSKVDDGYKELFKILAEKEDGCKPSNLSDLLCCPFCGGKATLDRRDNLVTCNNLKCGLASWIPYNDWQRRAT